MVGLVERGRSRSASRGRDQVVLDRSRLRRQAVNVDNDRDRHTLTSAQDQLRQPPAPADFDVVRHVLAGRDVRQALVHLADHVQHDADVGRLVELGEDDLVHPHVAEAGDRPARRTPGWRWWRAPGAPRRARRRRAGSSAR